MRIDYQQAFPSGVEAMIGLETAVRPQQPGAAAL